MWHPLSKNPFEFNSTFDSLTYNVMVFIISPYLKIFDCHMTLRPFEKPKFGDATIQFRPSREIYIYCNDYIVVSLDDSAICF